MYTVFGDSQLKNELLHTTYITVLKSKMIRAIFVREVLEKAYKSKEELDALVQEAGKEVSMDGVFSYERYMI